MDHHYFINMSKDIVLTAGSHPTTFLVERKGMSKENVDTIITSDDLLTSPPSCFFVGRQVAREKHWNIEDVVEVALVIIEEREDKEYLIVGFCVPGAAPTFTEQLIEIRRGTSGNITLLDNGEEQLGKRASLPAFVAGASSSALSVLEMAAVLLAAIAAKE